MLDYKATRLITGVVQILPVSDPKAMFLSVHPCLFSIKVTFAGFSAHKLFSIELQFKHDEVSLELLIIFMAL